MPSILRLCGLAIRVWLSLFGPHPCCKNKCFSRSVSSMVLTEGRVRGKAKEGLWTASCLVGVSRCPDLQGCMGQGRMGEGSRLPWVGPTGPGLRALQRLCEQPWAPESARK